MKTYYGINIEYSIDCKNMEEALDKVNKKEIEPIRVTISRGTYILDHIGKMSDNKD